MGQYRVEVTFEMDDEDLNDLVVEDAGAAPKLPPGWPELPPFTDDQVMELTTSALSLDNRWKVFNLLSKRLTIELGTWLNCPVRLTDPGLQVEDLADPDAPPMPGPR
jgi:hypothetical protein